MIANSSRAVPILVILALALGGVFYVIGPKTTAEIEGKFAEESTQGAPLFNDGGDAQAISDGPFHLAIRYGAGTMKLLVEETVSARMAGGAPMGDMGDKVTVSPLKVEKVDAGFPEGPEGIMVATVHLSGTLEVDLLGGGRLAARRGGSTPRVYQIRPMAKVRVKMEGQVVDDRPALVINILSLDRFELNVQDPPAGLSRISGKILPKIQKKVEAQLTTGAQGHRVMSLPDKLGKGDLPVRLIGAGLTIIPGEDGEMFLGMLTNLAVEPQVTAENRGAPLGDATWGLTLGETTLGAMLRAMAEVGKIPTRFSRQGEPSPDGEVRFQIKGATLSPEGFVMQTRLWNLAFPAFWQDFDVLGTLAFKDGSISPAIVGMEGGEGGGNTWVGSIIQKQQAKAPKTMATGGGRGMPPQMPLPMSGGKRVLQLNVEDLVLMDGAMTVKGTSEVKDAPGADAAQ